MGETTLVLQTYHRMMRQNFHEFCYPHKTQTVVFGKIPHLIFHLLLFDVLIKVWSCVAKPRSFLLCVKTKFQL